MVEGQQGLNWQRWRRLAAEVDDLGFAGLFRSDHFTDPQPPDRDSLEMLVSLAYLAGNTSRIHFGPLVAPVSFRDPIMLLRQAMALDDLSGGRMILGLGAGWQEREHQAFGYSLGDVPTRMARLEEALEIVTRLKRGDEPVTFEGDHYHLRGGATLLPRPQRPGGPPILIGGNGPRRTLPLAARYADIWNAVGLPPEVFRERSALLDQQLQTVGRQSNDVKRTLMHTLWFGRDTDDLLERLRTAYDDPKNADKTLEEWLAMLDEGWRPIVGTADMVVAQIQAYAAAGVEELMLQWLDLDDIERLREFARQVLPRV
jgi:F420-dependent oxidoreductase-like protein